MVTTQVFRLKTKSLQPIYLSSYVSDCIEQGSRVLVRDRQQRARWAGCGSSFLLHDRSCEGTVPHGSKKSGPQVGAWASEGGVKPQRV